MNTLADAERIYPEIVTYDLPQYPIYVRTSLLSYFHNYSAISHWHDDIELIYVISGSMQYNVNGEIVNLFSGEGILVNSRQFHFGFSSEKNECQFICILFHPSVLLVNEYIENHYVSPLINCETLSFLQLVPQIAWHKEILNLIVKIGNMDKYSPSFVLSCHQYLFQLFTLWYQNVEITFDTKTKADISLSQLRTMVGFIEAHYADTITLADIAAAGAMGKTSCCNTFKKYMRMTPVEYLISYRLKQSHRLLLSTDLSVTEIGFEAGFHNASYYTKIFHKYYGKTPNELRKEFLSASE